MEQQLFTWENFNQFDEAAYQFYKVCLVQPIGEHQIGKCFDSASLDFQHGTLEFYDANNNIVDSYKLILSIGEQKQTNRLSS